MKPQDIKIGMKVTPKTKSAPGFGKLENSTVWEKAQNKKQNFLYVVAIELSKTQTLIHNKISSKTLLVYMLNDIKTCGGDFFLAKDFIPYKKK